MLTPWGAIGPLPEIGFPLLAVGLSSLPPPVSLLREPSWTTPPEERVPFQSAPPTCPAFASSSTVTTPLTAPPHVAHSVPLWVSVSRSTRAWASAASGFLSLGTWARQMQRGALRATSVNVPPAPASALLLAAESVHLCSPSPLPLFLPNKNRWGILPLPSILPSLELTAPLPVALGHVNLHRRVWPQGQFPPVSRSRGFVCWQ